MLDAAEAKKVEATLEQLKKMPNIEVSKVMLGTSGPPCSKCIYWKPHVKVRKKSNGTYEIRDTAMCTSEENEQGMYSDFSCFKARVNQ